MNKNTEDQNIFKKLREIRRARGLTVDHLAKKMGENSQKVGRIERGKRSLTIDYLVKISKALDTSMDSLLNETEEAREKAPSQSTVLNDVIIFVENHCKLFLTPENVHQKAGVISKIYELILKVPKENQHLFLTLLSEVLDSFHQSEQPC